MDRIGGLSGYFIFSRSVWVSLLVSVMLSWGAMNIIALVFERRLLRPSTQFKSFYFGQLICWPGINLSLRHLSHQLPAHMNWELGWMWHVPCLVFALALGLVFHSSEKKVYLPPELRSPTKLWHDLVSLPLFLYVWFTAYPAVYYSTTGPWPRVIIGALAVVFGLLFLYDKNHPATEAHIGFDWRHLRPIRYDKTGY